MQRHRVGAFTDLLFPDVSLSYQQSRTGEVIPGSTLQYIATSGADGEFASFITSTYFDSWSTTGHAVHTLPRVPNLKAIPRLSTMFTGRTDILQRLAKYLNPSISSVTLKKQRIFVLYGLGGTGKTQIMAKFVNELGDQYDHDPLDPHYTRSF
jgi:hypothetical protein